MDFNIQDGVLGRYGYSGPGGHVVIPDGVIKLEEDSFYRNINAIISLKIPASVVEIEAGFLRHGDLEKISVDPKNPVFEVRNNMLINKKEHKIVLWVSDDKEVVVDADIKTIGSGSFADQHLIKKVIIKEGVTFIEDSAFKNCWGLEEITIPNSVSKIGQHAFAYCESLKNVKLPENISRIEAYTFCDCKSITSIRIPSKVEFIGECALAGTSLSKIDIPKSVVTIEEDAFKRNRGQKRKIKTINVEEENPVFYSSKGALVERNENKNVIISVPQGIGKEFRISDEITGAREDAFSYTDVESIYVHKSFIPNGKMLDNTHAKVIFEEGFLKRPIKLPALCVEALSDKEDCAYSILFQSGKEWDNAIGFFLKKKDDVCETTFKLAELIKQGQKESGVKKATEFVLKYINRLDSKAVKTFYLALFETKAKALSILINDIQAQNMLLDGQILPVGKAEKKNPIEKIVSENWKASDTTKKLKSIITRGIRYADSDEVSSPEAVILIITLYAEQMDDAPNLYSAYKTSYVHTRINSIADQIAEGLNKEDLRKLLEDLAYNERYQKDGYLLPFGRYASLSQISALMTNMREWGSWGRYGGIGRKNIIIARGALMLSDFREAMLAIDKAKGLSYYASIRNIDESTLRDSVLAEFGFDNKGKKTYDLGGNKAVISLATDLSLSIYDESAGKEVKSLPKKDADDKLYEKAKNDLADLRKNIKKVITNRKDLFFVDFLKAKGYEVENWKKSYLTNPVLNAIACLIVWQQGKKTFVPTRDGKIIDFTGAEIDISATNKIKIAHPIEMSEKDIAGWQKYFIDNSLKQPFEQIWEPVYREANIKKDRYKGCELPILRFIGKEKHGITAKGYRAYSEEFGFSLKDCDLSYSKDIWRYVPGFNDDATYELDDFTIKKFTRYANHIIYLLDKWTIEERIVKNDATIGKVLDAFTVAQIMNFISLASEKKSTDSLSVLMDYKNKKFSEYDPMQQFTLD